MLRSLVLVSLLSCWSAATTPAAPRATATATLSCTRSRQLEHTALTAWQGSLVAPTCTSIRGREPLVLVVDAKGFDGKPVGDPANSAIAGFAAIVDRFGRARWRDAWSNDTPGTWKTWMLVDLDGDGVDELIDLEERHGHMGFGSSRLIVYALTTRGLPTGGSQLILDQYGLEKGAEQNGCHATYRIARDPRAVIEVTGTRNTDPRLSPAPEDCPLVGIHRYAWTGAELIESH